MSPADEVHRARTYPHGVAEPPAPALNATCRPIEPGPPCGRCRPGPRRLDLADLAQPDRIEATLEVRDRRAA